MSKKLIKDFRLKEFKDLAGWIKRNVPFPLAYLLMGYLWQFETMYIEHKIKTEVDDAIKPFVDQGDVEIPHSYSEEPSDVDGLDTVEIRADYRKD